MGCNTSQPESPLAGNIIRSNNKGSDYGDTHHDIVHDNQKDLNTLNRPTTNQKIGRRRQQAIDNELKLQSQGVQAPIRGRKIVLTRSESVEESVESVVIVKTPLLLPPVVGNNTIMPVHYVPSPLASLADTTTRMSRSPADTTTRMSRSPLDASFRTLLKSQESKHTFHVGETPVFQRRLKVSVDHASDFDDSPTKIFLMDRHNLRH